MNTGVLELVFGGTDTRGSGPDPRVDRECTNCGATFDVDRTRCPECGSGTTRTRERTPSAELYLVLAVLLAGVEIAYNLATGQYPKEGAGA